MRNGGGKNKGNPTSGQHGDSFARRFTTFGVSAVVDRTLQKLNFWDGVPTVDEDEVLRNTEY